MDRVFLSEKSNSVTLMGMKYKIKEISEISKENLNLLKHFESIIWFSYRRNFPILKPIDKNRGTYISDTGWGCMIRAGQMMLSEALKRHLTKDYFNIKFSLSKNKKLFMNIIDLFLDSQNNPLIAPFSIQQISLLAAKNFNLKPGEWYKATSITMILEELHKNYNSQNLKDFSFCIFQDGFLNDIKLY